MPEPSAIDPTVIDDLRRSMPDLLGRLIRIYLEHSARLVLGIGQAAAAGDRVAVGKAAHTLKSSSATLGAMTLADQLKKLERLSVTGDGSDDESSIDALVAQVSLEFERVQVSLAELSRDLEVTALRASAG